MSSEFAARLLWAESLGKPEAKVLLAALQSALGPQDDLEGLNEGEEELLDNLTEDILAEEPAGGWVGQMAEADREAVAATLLWLQYPEGELPEMEEAHWLRLEEVAAAVAMRTAALAGHEMAMI